MKKYIKNVFWLSTERVLSIFGGLLITIYMARYLGPEKMGIFNFSLAIAALIVPVCQLGSDTLVFNRISRNLVSGVLFLKSTLHLRLGIYITLSILVFSYCYYQGYSDGELSILFLMLVSSLFSSQDIYRVYFDAQLQSKFNSISTQAGLYVSHLLRIILIQIHAGFLWFSLPFIANTFIPFLWRKNRFSKKTKMIELPKRARFKYNKYLLTAGFPLAISGLSVVIYTRIAQVILGESLSVEAVGIYSSAINIGQGWFFLPMAIITTLMTKIVKDRNTITQGISFLYLICIFISVPIIVIYYFASYQIIWYTYGAEYIEAAQYISLIALATMFSAIGTASARGIVALGGYKYLMYKMLIMALINILLSSYTIKNFGITGAVYSLLFTEFISCTLANYFFSNGSILKAQIGIVRSYTYITKLA